MENKSFGLVSIIMPLYNCEQYIAKSIESVINQTYHDWELLIVDDCSTDKSVEVVKSYDDKRIRLLSNERNSGAAVSRNYALREAKGKWIAFLDSDDYWANEKIEKQLSFMVSNGFDISYTDYQLLKEEQYDKYIYTAPNYINYRRILRYCYPFTSTMMYNANVIGLIQITNLKKNNDYAMWLHVFNYNTGYRLNECLATYVKHRGSISNVSKMRLIKYHYILFKQELGLNSFKSFLFTIRNLWFGLWKKIIYKRKIK